MNRLDAKMDKALQLLTSLTRCQSVETPVTNSNTTNVTDAEIN